MLSLGAYFILVLIIFWIILAVLLALKYDFLGIDSAFGFHQCYATNSTQILKSYYDSVHNMTVVLTTNQTHHGYCLAA